MARFQDGIAAGVWMSLSSGSECDEIAGFGGFSGGVVRAQNLRSAVDGGVAPGGFVGLDAGESGIRHRADQIALPDQPWNQFGVARGVVAFGERGVWCAGIGVGEQDAAFERRMAFRIERSDAALVEKKDNFAAGFVERRPAAG